MAGCYLFTVPNSGLLFSHRRLVLPCNVHKFRRQKGFSSYVRKLCTVTLMFESDLERVKAKLCNKYLGESSFNSKIVVRTQYIQYKIDLFGRRHMSQGESEMPTLSLSMAW